MFLDLDGARVQCLTGGPPFDPALPIVVFLHGAGMDGSVWALQTRWLAHHGFAVLAPDFPAHGRSGGTALRDIDVMADWVVRLLRDLGVSSATLIGHSMGSLVALAVANRHPSTVNRLVLIGTAARIKVGPDLLAAAQIDDPDAFAMVNLWGHGPRAGLGGSEIPGLWMTGGGQRLLERSKPGVLACDLAACDAFRPLDIVSRVAQAALILQGTRDVMTPLKSAHELAGALPNARLQEVGGAGHMTMVEEGQRILELIASDLTSIPDQRTVTRPIAAQP